jgi:hypothetical protein
MNKIYRTLLEITLVGFVSGAITYSLQKIPIPVEPIYWSHINNDSVLDALIIKKVDDIIISQDRMQLTQQERLEKTLQLCFVDGNQITKKEKSDGTYQYYVKNQHVKPIQHAYLKDIPKEWLKLEVRQIDDKNDDQDIIIKTLINKGNPYGPIDTIYDINANIIQR